MNDPTNFPITMVHKEIISKVVKSLDFFTVDEIDVKKFHG